MQVLQKLVSTCRRLISKILMCTTRFFLFSVLKGVGILLKVFFTLLMLQPYSVIIIQNPPCLPALIAAYMISLVNGSTIIIDWHNLGYAMFAQRLGSDHLLVKLARNLENVVCRLAHKHICVSEAMKDWLTEHFSVKAVVLYDRPAKIFSAISPSLQQRHCLLSRLEYRDNILFPSLTKLVVKGDPSADQTADDTSILSGELSTCQTAFENINSSNNAGVEGGLTLCNDRAKIVVSATSWTDDEDFSMLLEALQQLDLILLASLPAENERVLVVVTGKGPLKAAFEAGVRDLTARGLLQRVAVKTAWLSSEDYSLLLRCADLGICLHTSSSGLDLPMKVVSGL
jgi:beta-1,4-mannosyltransferase